MTVTSSVISQAVSRMNLDRKPLLVHSSLRSFGRVSGGPKTVIDGLLAQGCTVMVPTFSHIYEITPPDEDRPLRNGIDYATYQMDPAGAKLIYSTDSNKINDTKYSMGVIPKFLLSMDGRHRGNQPRGSFAAIGPLSAELIAPQSPLDMFSPIDKLSSLGGMVVLMGVGLTRMTALHLAEKMSGRVPFRRWVNGEDGKPLQVEFGACSEGFDNLEPILSDLEEQTMVGNSLWRIFPADELLKHASTAIKENPMITHCNKKCQYCDDAIAGGPILIGETQTGQQKS